MGGGGAVPFGTVAGAVVDVSVGRRQMQMPQGMKRTTATSQLGVG